MSVSTPYAVFDEKLKGWRLPSASRPVWVGCTWGCDRQVHDHRLVADDADHVRLVCQGHAKLPRLEHRGLPGDGELAATLQDEEDLVTEIMAVLLTRAHPARFDAQEPAADPGTDQHLADIFLVAEIVDCKCHFFLR